MFCPGCVEFPLSLSRAAGRTLATAGQDSPPFPLLPVVSRWRLREKPGGIAGGRASFPPYLVRCGARRRSLKRSTPFARDGATATWAACRWCCCLAERPWLREIWWHGSVCGEGKFAHCGGTPSSDPDDRGHWRPARLGHLPVWWHVSRCAAGGGHPRCPVGLGLGAGCRRASTLFGGGVVGGVPCLGAWVLSASPARIWSCQILRVAPFALPRRWAAVWGWPPWNSPCLWRLPLPKSRFFSRLLCPGRGLAGGAVLGFFLL